MSLSAMVLGSGAKLVSSSLITAFRLGASFFPQSSNSFSLSDMLYFTAPSEKETQWLDFQDELQGCYFCC